MANPGEKHGMWANPGDDKSRADGSQGHRNETHMLSSFPDNPVLNEWTDDQSWYTFFISTLLGVQNQNTDYAAVNDQKGIDMDYAGNIPKDDPHAPHDDLAGMLPPHRVPNPFVGGEAPADYKDTMHTEQLGDGIGSALLFEESSKTQGGVTVPGYGNLHPGKGPGTPIGG